MERRKPSLMCFFLAAGFVASHSLVVPVLSKSLEQGLGLGDQKTHGKSSHRHSQWKPSCACPTPSHGGGGSPSHGGGGSRSHGGSPSHGGGSTPTPTPTLTPPSHGGSCGTPPTLPPPPEGGSCGTPPPQTLPPPPQGGVGCGTPSPPSGGGGYYSPPPSTPVISTPPSPVFDPVTPTTPTAPIISSPPSPPVDPNNPPFVPAPCSYWIAHPGAIWAIFGYWGTVGSFFGPAVTAPFGGNPSLLQALSNTRSDGIGALYREGTAAFLNSIASKRFAYTPQQVKDAFVAAAGSDKAAGAQARLFKLANEGHPVKH